MNTIGERIEAVRNKTGLSQESFAESIGVSRNSYFKYVRGHRAVPSDVFSAILEKYGTDPVWIHEGDTGLSSRTTSLLEDMKQIVFAVDDLSEERGLQLDRDKRWLIACRICVDRVLNAKQNQAEDPIDLTEINKWLEIAQ
ncbi:MAG: helix-turn-helix transcriptional regulator [Hyphomicrobiales bacterium]